MTHPPTLMKHLLECNRSYQCVFVTVAIPNCIPYINIYSIFRDFRFIGVLFSVVSQIWPLSLTLSPASPLS